MKKFLALLAVATLGVMSLHAQTTEEFVTVGDGIANTWELRLDGAWGNDCKFYRQDGEGAIKSEESTKANIGIGYNLNSNLYLGLGSGYAHNMGGGTNHFVPALGDITYRWNGKGGKWSFFLEGRGGYMFSVGSAQTLKNGQKYETPSGLMFDVMPGVYYRILRNLDLKLAVGFMHFNPFDDTPDLMHCTNNVLFKLGLNIRKAVKAPVRTVVEEAPAPAPEPEPVVAPEPAPAPAPVVETKPEPKQLFEREVIIHYNIRLHNISPEKDALLKEMAEFVKTHKTGKVVLKSYADKGTGNYQLNQMYSRNRMNEVKKHLVEQYGIPAEKIDASYYGDTVQPFAENDLNRCSIITVKEVE